MDGVSQSRRTLSLRKECGNKLAVTGIITIGSFSAEKGVDLFLIYTTPLKKSNGPPAVVKPN
jgi:hypothetical protein